MRRMRVAGVLLVVLLTVSVRADIPPRPDANDAVFTATEIVIVSSKGPRSFTVERSYRGKFAVGATVELPTFRLLTWDKMGDEQVQPLTDGTRILMFLQPDEKDPAVLTLGYFGYAYFFRDVAKMDELDAMAKGALVQQKQWEAARDLVDPQARIRALFPYLLHAPASCFRLTLQEMAKLNPAAGDYLAEMIGVASPEDCSTLLLRVRELQSPKSLAAAKAAVDRARAQFAKYLESRQLKALDIMAHWNEVPEDVKNANGILYYGLAALGSFHDRGDTAYFREIIPFLLANDFSQPVEECVYAMGADPAPENVGVLNAIWRDYKAHGYPPANEPLMPIYLARALAEQKDVAVVPTLLEMLDNGRARDEARMALHDVTGKYMPTDAAWKAWYAAQSRPRP